MRGFLLVALLISASIAGCTGNAPAPATQPPTIDVATLKIPDGAVVETLPNGVALKWLNVDVPFSEEITVPVGTTIVRLTGQEDAGALFGVSMSNAETARRRCNTLGVLSWDQSILGTKSCTGLAAVDQLPATWKISVGAGTNVAQAELVRVEFLATPLDGPASLLDLSQISKIEYTLKETEKLRVPSFDGKELYVEVTVPDAPGPFPVVIWSSPYEQGAHIAGVPSAWNYFVKDWAMRGYAVVAADVRGYAYSDGCVEVWGYNEQKDQKFLVDWAAEQPWSNGNVGFYGQSYVATTPVAAAVQDTPALKAIIAVAPVISAYEDWHFGGVPNGESYLSPIAYQAMTAGLGNAQPTDLDALTRIGNGLCDPTLIVRANDPRAIYDDFYRERDFGARASSVKAATLYTQGFVDSNVKSSMIPGWFNAITAPKLGLFGPWVHQHPTRADNEVLMLAWLDQYVKGKPVGLENLAKAYITTAQGEERAADEWPATSPNVVTVYANLGAGKLGTSASDGSAQLVMDGTAAIGMVPVPATTTLAFDGVLEETIPLAGVPNLHLRGTLDGATNAHVVAFLDDVDAEGVSKQVTFGMINLAHRNGHDTYEPVTPGETWSVDLPMIPTEWTLKQGHTLKLTIRATQNADWAAAIPSQPGIITLVGGEEGVQLRFPLATSTYLAIPATAQP